MFKTLFCILGLLALLAVPVGGEISYEPDWYYDSNKGIFIPIIREDDPGYITTQEIIDSNPFQFEGIVEEEFSLVMEDEAGLIMSVTSEPYYDQVTIGHLARRIEMIDDNRNVRIKVFSEDKVIILHEPGWTILRDYEVKDET